MISIVGRFGRLFCRGGHARDASGDGEGAPAELFNELRRLPAVHAERDDCGVAPWTDQELNARDRSGACGKGACEATRTNNRPRQAHLHGEPTGGACRANERWPREP